MLSPLGIVLSFLQNTVVTGPPGAGESIEIVPLHKNNLSSW